MNVLTHLPFTRESFERFQFDGWQARMAKETAKRAPGIAVESWLPAEIPNRVSVFRDGVDFRAFPSRKNPFNFSWDMQKAASALARDDVLQLHGDRSMLAYSLMAARPRKFVQHHGSYGLSVLTPLELWALRRPELICCVSVNKMNYLQSIGISQSKLRFRTMGVDTDVFSPRGKAECRKKLGLKEDAVVILHPGRFDTQKGTDIILRAYDALRQRLEIELLLVGGSSSDPLYEEARRRTRHVHERVPQELMPYFYSAADVTCYYWRPPALWYGGGGSVSVLESLSCDTPVVSNTLPNFEFLRIEKSVGEVPSDETDVPFAIERALENRHGYRCREIAEKHFSWNVVIASTLRDYHLPDL